MSEERPADPSFPRATFEGSLPTQATVSVDSLATAYVIVLQSLAETLFEHTAPTNEDVNSRAPVRRRLEVCAAVWAANSAALRTSTLSIDEQSRMQKAVWQRLHIYWQDFCGSPGEISGWVEKRAPAYLEHQNRREPIATANLII
jgi:hypothetical protein